MMLPSLLMKGQMIFITTVALSFSIQYQYIARQVFPTILVSIEIISASKRQYSRIEKGILLLY